VIFKKKNNYILQGVVATQLRCGGVFTANFLHSVTVKEFLKSDSLFGEYIDTS